MITPSSFAFTHLVAISQVLLSPLFVLLLLKLVNEEQVLPALLLVVFLHVHSDRDRYSYDQYTYYTENEQASEDNYFSLSN